MKNGRTHIPLCNVKTNISHSFRATDIAKGKKRSKVTAEDVFTALQELDLDKYEETLRDFLRHYNADKEDQAQQKKLLAQK